MTASALAAQVETIEKRVDQLEPCVKDIDNWLNGNGKQGAKIDIALMAQQLKDIKVLLNRLLWAMVGLVFSVIGALILFFLTQVVPHVSTP